MSWRALWRRCVGGVCSVWHKSQGALARQEGKAPNSGEALESIGRRGVRGGGLEVRKRRGGWGSQSLGRRQVHGGWLGLGVAAHQRRREAGAEEGEEEEEFGLEGSK